MSILVSIGRKVRPANNSDQGLCRKFGSSKGPPCFSHIPRVVLEVYCNDGGTRTVPLGPMSDTLALSFYS